MKQTLFEVDLIQFAEDSELFLKVYENEKKINELEKENPSLFQHLMNYKKFMKENFKIKKDEIKLRKGD